MPMPKGLALLVAAVVALCGVGRAADSPGPRTKEKPFFDARSRATEYAGPGRETPEPTDVAEVLLGYFGPSDPADREGGDAWRAAQLALEEVNRQGGYRGTPFRLVPGWSDQPWKDGATQVTRMVYRQQVWAVLGGPDGTTTHLAEQVVAKARLPLVSPGSTDRTANLANVPWMFSMLPGDHLQAPPLAAELASVLAGGPFGIISGEDHDARQFVLEFHRAGTALRLQAQWQYVCPSERHVPEVVAKVLDAKPAAVVIVAGATRSAAVVAALRKAGYAGRLFGGPAFGRRAFLEAAGRDAEGAVFPLLYLPRSSRFAEDFARRCGHPPDYTAACTYDAVKLIADAVRNAGLNRARIADALRELSPWQGECGAVRWDGLGSNARPVPLGTIRQGRLCPHTPTSGAAAPAATQTPAHPR